jgi:hypothetical protein
MALPTRLPTTLRATAHVCKRQHRLSSNALFARYRKASVPEGGWTAENFRGAAAEDLIEDFINIQRIAVARGIRSLAPALKKWFDGSAERIIANAMDGWRRVLGVPLGRSFEDSKAPEDFDFDIGAHEEMWAAAIQQELALAGSEVVLITTPTITSVSDEVFSKVAIAIGYEPTPNDLRLHRGRIANRVNQVTRINETTRTRLRNTIGNAIRSGEPPAAVAAKIRKRMPEIASNRAQTIARTELGQSSDEATLLVMKQSEVVTHVSVLGCETIDQPPSPHFDGMPTCNIRNVPIVREEELIFHPNHTGAIVPSAFRQEDGSVLPLNTLPGGPYD